MIHLSPAQIRQIIGRVNSAELIQDQEAGFTAYSRGQCEIPPAAHLYFKSPPGDCHIKYGYVKGDEYFVIKVATGFTNNSALNLPSGSGLMLAWSATTGLPYALIEDQGFLTDLRTALAGAIAAKYLAPKNIQRIGVIGTGVQARLQVLHLKQQTSCREVLVWGRNQIRLEAYQKQLSQDGFQVEIASDPQFVATKCNLIVTATSAQSPLLWAKDVKPGTHITAVGADGNGKQELDPQIFKRADICVVDSIAECERVGDSSYALKQGLVQKKDLHELGNIILDAKLRRTSDQQITVADLAGNAIQDIQVVKSVLKTWKDLKP